MDKKGMNQVDWIISTLLFLGLLFFIITSIRPFMYMKASDKDYQLESIRVDIYSRGEKDLAFIPINLTNSATVGINLSDYPEISNYYYMYYPCFFKKIDSFHYQQLDYYYNNDILTIFSVPTNGLIYFNSGLVANCSTSGSTGALTSNIIIGYNETKRLFKCDDPVPGTSQRPINIIKSTKSSGNVSSIFSQDIPSRGSVYGLEMKDYCFYVNSTTKDIYIEPVIFNINIW